MQHVDDDFEQIFTNALVFDGSGRPTFKGTIHLKGQRISAVKEGLSDNPAAVDCNGLAIAPGFIDVHTHDDAALLLTPDMACKASQGVTTVVTGNCGVSLAPLDLKGRYPAPPLDAVAPIEAFRYPTMKSYVDALEDAPPALNAACLVGHGTLRVMTMDALDRPADKAEKKAMRHLVDEAIDAGAIGLSSGLFYPPANAAPAQEVVEMLKPFGEIGGVYTAHIRDEADHVMDALDEAFAIADAAGVRLVISHHKVSGVQNFGRTRETLPKIAKAATHQDITLDVYPYAASSTMLNKVSWQASARTMITWCKSHPHYTGWDLADAAKDLGLSEEEAIDQLVPAGGIYFMMDEEDVERILATPEAMIGSDGVPLDAHPHPRLWGSFTRVLGHFARDKGLFTQAEAIRRMTSLPAARFSLKDRGTIGPGCFADLVIFDPETVGDAATFEHPSQPSHGIEAVYVNGAAIWRSGATTNARPGQVISSAA